MTNRRQFIGATALGLIPTAMAFESGHLAAQAARAEMTLDDTATRVLNQVAAENARAYNDAVAHGSKADHFRTASTSLRMLAAVNLDVPLRRAVQQHGRALGHDGGTLAHLDHAAMARELRKVGMRISAEDVERLQLRFGRKKAAVDAVSSPQFSLSRELQRLAAMLDDDAALTARIETGPIRRVVRALDCDKYAYQIDMLSFATGVLCMVGAAPGCLAAMTSIALISTAMYWAGC